MYLIKQVSETNSKVKTYLLTMPRNIEIKAYIRDYSRVFQLAQDLSKSEPTILNQVDTFFNCPNGRFKLREFAETNGELIFYVRADTKESKQSDYSIYRTINPKQLGQVLTQALGSKIVVKKKRTLFLVSHDCAGAKVSIGGQTRIHLDEVEGLGRFVELEVVLSDGQSVEEGSLIANSIMKALEIKEEDLIDKAYADLLQQQ